MISLYQQAVLAGKTPNLPAERAPFIEAYARLGDWQSAQALSLQSAAEKPNPREGLCRLWQTLQNHTPASPQRSAAWDAIRVKLECGN